MRIVLDSNVIIEKNWRLSGPDIQLLHKAVGRAGIEIFVPEVVIQEVVNARRIRLKERLKKAVHHIHSVNKVVSQTESIPIPEVNVREEVKSFEELLRRRIDELGASKPDYEGISHSTLVAKALHRKKPFGTKDRGYRDGLIWETIIRNVADKNDVTIFVTNNTKDFCDSNGELHTDLKQELEERGFRRNSVIVYRSLTEVIEKHVKPILSLQAAEPEIFSFTNWFNVSLDGIIAELQTVIDTSGMPSTPDELFESSAYIEQLGLVSDETLDAYILDERRAYIEISSILEASFSQFIYYSEYFWLSESVNINVSHLDADDKAVEATFTLSFPTRFAMIFNIPEACVEEFSVELGEFFGSCKHCDLPIESDAAEECPACGRSLF